MPEETKALQQLPAKSINHVLRLLHSARQESKPMPYTLFYLQSGQIIGGWLLDIQEDQGSTWLLLNTSDNMRTHTTDVSYIALSSVVAITLHYVGAWLPELSFGKITMPIHAEVPTRLQLRQKLQQISDRFPHSFNILWESFPDTSASYYHLGQMLEHLPAALEKIACTDIGREALSTILEIKLIHSPEWGITKLNNSLDIYFSTTPSVSELETAIARVL
ncbi:MAG: hypothetical protein ACK4QL_09920 [Pseudanabaenaceae cyanobacterium]